MRSVMKIALAGAAVMAAANASAQVTFSGSATGPIANTSPTTFDNRVLGSTPQMTNTGISVAFTGTGAFVQGTSPGIYQAPFVYGGLGSSFGGQPNGADTTTYVSSGVGTAILTFAAPQTYIGMLIGSVDPYNTLSFYSGTNLIQSITGSQIMAGQGASNAVNGSLYVNFTSTTAFTSVVAASTQNAFELDDVALRSAVPEAAVWAMMMVGLGVVGGAVRRRRTSTRVSFA